ncbi:16991_t:CDS:2 [Dentiscutata heterogama]|uniref:16991_t:CDS:1 n=1 Tax=Dentiscutata heterogama TaxID=1316150 RepID=A0ACA9LM87_9GLOM|nr:16991_t:CDS:2 [Dentiscutata heterogama]
MNEITTPEAYYCEQTTTSRIREILTQIEKSLKGNQDRDIVKISLPVNELNKVGVRNAINAKYDAEIIDSNLFIKFDGGVKERIHRRISNSCEAQRPEWFTEINMICMVGNSQLRPDVGIWFRTPTHAQMIEPVADFCPPPDIWIEVFFNRDPDRSNAIDKIDFIQRTWIGIEFVGICIPHSRNPISPNPHPGSTITSATSQTIRPYRAPYVIYWDLNGNLIYYIMDWNHNLTLRCGLTIDFNIVLAILSASY